jgi:hypothetical protein
MGKHLLIVVVLMITVSCGRTQTAKTNPETPLTQDDGNLLADMLEGVSKIVDSIYGLKELRKDRARIMNHKVDTCQEDLASFNSFAEMQNYFVLKHLENRPAQMQFLAATFDLPPDINKIFPTSFISNEMCPITKAALDHSLDKKNIPDADTISKLNEFSKISNALRSEYLKNPTYETKLNVSEHWAKLIKCLSYIESYTTADTTDSKKTAAKYAPPDYRKPAGVSFYFDDPPKPESKLNIGTYQFDPNADGNVRPCIRQWNVLFPKCSVSLDANEDEMIRTLGSELQAFNIFCGIDKISQTFSVQVNSSNPVRTSLANNPNNKLKSAKNRCVSINFRANGYNHFGPFQNSSGKNLKELMGCYFE